MVARTTVTVYDDLDNSEGASTVSFAYGGTSYDIDLGEKNQAALDKALAKYIAAARRSGRAPAAAATGRRRATGAADRRADLAAIRTWARENGHEVSDRGRISVDVQEAYDAAH
ncbi:MAG: histone-like nucleoid-structuring protein Lsr2 [Jatrophihabitans sp.]